MTDMTNTKTFLATALFLFLPTVVSAQTTVITFDDLSAYTDTISTGSYYNGHGNGAAAPWTAGGILFPTNTFGPGFSYSNVNDPNTAGFTNQFAAFPGTDVSGTGNYVTFNGSSAVGSQTTFDTPGLSQIDSVAVTNTTYTYRYIVDALAPGFSPPPEPYDNDDFFTLRFTGYDDIGGTGNVTGIVDFTLADYRFTDDANDFAIADWQTVDLTGLGLVRSVGLGFESERASTFGSTTFYDTPTYAALDNLTITAVPEPTSMVAVAMIGLARIRRRIRRC